MPYQMMRKSIGAKIFAAFLAMSLMIGAIGYYSYTMLDAAGKIVIKTYDGPLMAINYSRSASLTFLQMQKTLLEKKLAPVSQSARYDQQLDDLTKTFYEDIAVALERSDGPDERAVIGEITSLMNSWSAIRHNPPTEFSEETFQKIDQRIIERFDFLVELNTGHSFVSRRMAISSIARFEIMSALATLIALVAAAGMTWALTRKIIQPLASAAQLANRIAGGKLDTEVPEGGQDETGILLRSMRIMRDSIREMVAREQRQRLSAENRLIDALESANEGVLLLDASGRLVVANSEISAFFSGISALLNDAPAAEAIHAIMRASIVDEDEAKLALLDESRATRQSISVEVTLKDKRCLRMEGSPTSDGGFILLMSDFTQVKAREEALRVAKQNAEAASEAKSNFLANMSHELRTPLNAIIGFSEIIAGQVFGKVENPRYLDYANDIVKSGRHLLGIINNVLELSRGQAGKMTIEKLPVDLRQTLGECLPMLRDQCTTTGLTLNLPLSGDPVMVAGDEGKLRQIFLNLISNAIKFSESGGRIDVRFDMTPEGAVLVQIADTGIGMRPEDIAVAMAPFGQVDSRLARRYEGTGLGLPLTQAMVKLHDGTMQIASEPGQGTIVTIMFPPFDATRQISEQRAAS